MPPAARITDDHTCPQDPHVGGPVDSGETTVLIGFQPAARVGDSLIHGGKIVEGCPTVLIGSSNQADALKTDKPFCEECEKAREAQEKLKQQQQQQQASGG
jgi:hypothetical protein